MSNNILIIDDLNQKKDEWLNCLEEINCQWEIKSIYDVAEDPLRIKSFDLMLHFLNQNDFSAKFIQNIKYEFDFFIPIIAIDLTSSFSFIQNTEQPYDDIYSENFNPDIFKLRICSYLKLKVYHDRIYQEKMNLESSVRFSLDILKNISIGILLFNQEGIVVFENDFSVKLLGNALDEHINVLFRSDRFITGKTAHFDFLDEEYNESLYLSTQNGNFIEVKRMNTDHKSAFSRGALVIKEIQANPKLIKANHQSLKSFLKHF